MFAGHYRTGDEISVPVLCKNASGSPTDPDECPKADVYAGATKVVSGKGCPILDKAATTGLFWLRLFLGELFTDGEHTVVFRWKIGSHNGSATVIFRILPSGDPSGQAISLAPYNPAHADFIVQQRTSGRIYKGKGPRL